MKFLSVLLFSIISATAYSATLIQCDSHSNDHSLLMYVNGNKLVNLRIQEPNSFPRALNFSYVTKNEQYTTYVIAGTSALLDIENAVLNFQNGSASLNGEHFYCVPN